MLRTPSQDFDAAMLDLAELGKVTASTRKAEDATSQVIDTRARIRAQEQSLERVEVLFARARSIRDIVAIEAQLSRRQADLDSPKGQLAYLEDQTTFSTITVYLELAPEAPKAATPTPEDDDTAFVAGLKDGWHALSGLGAGLATVAGALLPFAVVALADRRGLTGPYSGSVDTDYSAVRIAVLIDADNTSPKYAEAILDELAKFGTPTIKRAYGDFSSNRLSGWTRELNGRAIRAIHQNAFTTGKNSTDSALIIDAMDLLYAGNVEAFAIVSSDSDFTSLALRLRESGKLVYGLGRQRTAISLQNACDRFIMLEVLGTEPHHGQPVHDEPYEDDDEDGPDAVPVPQLNLESVLSKAVNATADDDGWTTLGAIGNHLARTLPSWDPRTFGHSKLSSLVADLPYLETRPSGSHLQVALKQPRKPAAKKAAARGPAKKSAAKKS